LESEIEPDRDMGGGAAPLGFKQQPLLRLHDDVEGGASSRSASMACSSWAAARGVSHLP
jgi:hypothetical protein